MEYTHAYPQFCIGNIKFEESGTSASKVSANGQKYLKIACELMNIDNMANVSQAFTTKLLKIRGQADTYTSLYQRKHQLLGMRCVNFYMAKRLIGLFKK